MAHQVIFIVFLNFSSCSYPRLHPPICLHVQFVISFFSVFSSQAYSSRYIFWYQRSCCCFTVWYWETLISQTPFAWLAVGLLMHPSAHCCFQWKSIPYPLLWLFVSPRMFCVFEFVQHQRQVIFWRYLPTADLKCVLPCWSKVQT